VDKQSFVAENGKPAGAGFVASTRRLFAPAGSVSVRTQLRFPLERLRRRLVPHSSYSRLRGFLPVPALALVWLLASRSVLPKNYEDLLGVSVTFRHILLAIEIAAIWNICLFLSPSRRRSVRGDIEGELWLLIRASFVCGLFIYVAEVLQHKYVFGMMLASWVFVAFLLASFSLLFFFFCISANIFQHASMRRTALIFGTGPRAIALRQLIQESHAPLEVIGCLDDEYLGINEEEDNYLGGFDMLAPILKNRPIELVLIGLPVKSMYDRIQSVIATCESIGVESHYMSDVFATSLATHQPSPHSPDFTVLSTLSDDPRQIIKRLFDLLVASLLLILISPILLGVAIAIKFTSKGPIFFIQQRYGLHRKQFAMFKFRTMVVDAEQRQAALEEMNEAQGPVFKLKTDPRITGIGAFLRKTSLDELPQLFNVVRGEMSLVGPRPLPLRDVARFEEAWLLRRFSVRPGLTCLWQVRGRSNTTFDEWIKLDLEYIDSWSFGLDVSILAQTVPAVLRGSGAM
jgi:exopolysaccharide biosynthesis polyprenyl glycosylphosphotransferase